MRATSWPEGLKERDPLENLSVDGKRILKLALRKQSVRVWTGFTWLRIGIIGRLL
jgi:hypothetical protein